MNEVAQHLLSYRKVCDHPVAQRTRRGDRRRRAADHPLGLDTDRVDLAGQRVHGKQRRAPRQRCPCADVHNRVRGTEVDRDVTNTQARRQMTPRYIPARAVSTQTHQDSLSDTAAPYAMLPPRANGTVPALRRGRVGKRDDLAEPSSAPRPSARRGDSQRRADDPAGACPQVPLRASLLGKRTSRRTRAPILAQRAGPRHLRSCPTSRSRSRCTSP